MAPLSLPPAHSLFILGQDLTGQLSGNREVEQVSQLKVIFIDKRKTTKT